MNLAELLGAALYAAATDPDTDGAELTIDGTAVTVYAHPGGYGWVVYEQTYSYRDGPECVEVASGGADTLADTVDGLHAVLDHFAEQDRLADEQITAALLGAAEAERAACVRCHDLVKHTDHLPWWEVTDTAPAWAIVK